MSILLRYVCMLPHVLRSSNLVNNPYGFVRMYDGPYKCTPGGGWTVPLNFGISLQGLGPNLDRITPNSPSDPLPYFKQTQRRIVCQRIPRKIPKKYIWETRQAMARTSICVDRSRLLALRGYGSFHQRIVRPSQSIGVPFLHFESYVSIYGQVSKPQFESKKCAENVLI